LGWAGFNSIGFFYYLNRFLLRNIFSNIPYFENSYIVERRNDIFKRKKKTSAIPPHEMAHLYIWILFFLWEEKFFFRLSIFVTWFITLFVVTSMPFNAIYIYISTWMLWVCLQFIFFVLSLLNLYLNLMYSTNLNEYLLF
jgi:hypothetical protein